VSTLDDELKMVQLELAQSQLAHQERQHARRYSREAAVAEGAKAAAGMARTGLRFLLWATLLAALCGLTFISGCVLATLSSDSMPDKSFAFRLGAYIGTSWIKALLLSAALVMAVYARVPSTAMTATKTLNLALSAACLVMIDFGILVTAWNS
jgi:predicted secreted protein